MAFVQGDFELHVNSEVVLFAQVLEEVAQLVSKYSLSCNYCQPSISKSGLML